MAYLSTQLGQRIKKLRKSRKWTQAQLAEHIGMETTNLCRLENGGQLPKEENIIKLAKIFNIQIKELFDFEHMISHKKLQEEITEFVNNASKKDLELYYRILVAIKENV